MTRSKRTRDLDEYMLFMKRVLSGAARRFGEDDPEQLHQLLQCQRYLDQAIENAIVGLRRSGATWQDIGEAAGTSRQAAYERWAHKVRDA